VTAVTDSPTGFDTVVARAMATRPDDRFQSAGEFVQATLDAARDVGPEPSDPVPFPAAPAPVDSDAPTAG
jgi:hypothetical protein